MISKVKEVLETYKDGNLDKAEEKNFEEMRNLWEALETEWQKRMKEWERDFEPKDLKDMTAEELEEQLEYVDNERKIFWRRRRGTAWSKEEEEEYDRMNAWAAAVVGEIGKRSGSE